MRYSRGNGKKANLESLGILKSFSKKKKKISAKWWLVRSPRSLFSAKEKFVPAEKRGAEKGAAKGRVWIPQGSTVIGAIRSSLEWK